MTSVPLNIPLTLQDLPPKWAHFCLRIEKFIVEDLSINLNKKCIVSAFSGGIDSTCLLLVLHYLSLKNSGRVIAVHLDHKLRAESADDAQWAQLVCDTMGVECVVESKDIKAFADKCNMGIEEAGRKARYDFFQDVLTAKSCDYISVGHHLDDLCEDVLMRLTRGTGWPGLSGMKANDPDRHLVRPLLLTPKDTLTEFLNDIDMPWREDASNSAPAWTRNRIRNDVMPLLLKENPNFPESIARLWKLGKIEEQYWAAQVTDSSDTIFNTVLDQAHQALRLRLYKSSLDNLGKGQALADTLFKLDRAWRMNRVGSSFQFPGNKTATIVAHGVVFCRTH